MIETRIEYSLTERGASLLQIMDLFADWSRENITLNVNI